MDPRLLTVESPIPGADAQRGTSTVSCDAVVLVPPKVESSRAPEQARKYPMRDRELELHDAPRGVVEAGARGHPMDRSAGWVNVYPEALSVMPAQGIGFWVRAKDREGPRRTWSRDRSADTLFGLRRPVAAPEIAPS